MSGNITVESTTDTAEEVAAAAGLEPVAASASTPAADKPATTAAGRSESGDGSGPSEEGNEPEAQDSAQAIEDQEQEDIDATEDENQDDTEDETPGDDQTAVAAKGKGGFQKRINKLTKEKSLLEVEVINRDRQMLTLQQQLAEIQRQQQASAAQAKKDEGKDGKAADAKPADASTLRARPKVGDFKTYEDYLDDMGKWSDEAYTHATTVAEAKAAERITAEVAKVKEEFKAEEATRRQKAELATVETNFRNDCATKGPSEFADWNERMSAAANLHISDVQHSVMLTHPSGYRLAYWYVSNPQESARIAGLPEGQQLLELGQVLATLSSKAKPAAAKANGNGQAAATSTTKASTAPKPVKPAGSGRPAKRAYTEKDIENMPYSQYKQLREQGHIR